jgi:hypothetical protein
MGLLQRGVGTEASGDTVKLVQAAIADYNTPRIPGATGAYAYGKADAPAEDRFDVGQMTASRLARDSVLIRCVRVRLLR